MEEAGSEAEHKAFCDAELATNAQTRKENTEELEMLYAEIDELEANIAQLSAEIRADGIFGLEKLLDKFMDKRTTLEKEVMTSKPAFNAMVIDLNG